MRKNRYTKLTLLHIALAGIWAVHLPVSAADNQNASIPLDLKESREEEIKKVSFKQIQRKSFPLTEEMVKDYKTEAERMEKLTNEEVRTTKVQNRTIKVTPSINQAEQIVLSSKNYNTNLIFVDSMGKPWPIQKFGIGASEFFTIDQYLPHALMVYPKKTYTKTNLTIILKGIETIPVVMSLVEDPNLVDYIVQMKINGRAGGEPLQSGYTQQLVSQPLIAKSDGLHEYEREMSDDITPDNSNRLRVLVNGQDVSSISAWQYKSHYYVRTQGELIIPTGKLITTSVDEFKLYRTPPISGIMIQKDGVMKTNIKLKKDKEEFYESQ